MATEIDIKDNEQDIVARIDTMPPVKFNIKQVTNKPTEPKIMDTSASQIPTETEIKAAEEVLAQVLSNQQAIRDTAKTAVPRGNGVADLKNLKIKPNTTSVDYSNMTEDDVYDLSIEMNARPFAFENSLKVVLKDNNYTARWVNKDPRRLGNMIARGFTYVTPADLAEKLEVEVQADVDGHFALGDVILMKIPKSIYLPALRANHIRAVASVGQAGAHTAAIASAKSFMSKQTSGEFDSYASKGKVDIYSPEIEI